MFQKVIKRISNEYASFSRAEKIFIMSIMLCSFAITGEAAITRATANSVFLSVYTAKLFPIAWLASVPINFAIVSFYNRFLPTFGCSRMLLLTVMVAIFINVFSAFYLKEIPLLPFILYLWKETFIILMFQQLWSVINASINTTKAKYLYGIFYGMGGIGSVVGSLFPGFLAVSLGSEKLLLTTIPFYLTVMTCYIIAMRVREKIAIRQDISKMSVDASDLLGGVKLILNSKFLKFILLITCCMQIASTMIDFQFSSVLEKVFVDQDLRTEFLGRFFGIVNTCNVFLQFIGTFLLVKWAGLKGAHFLIPFALGLNVLTFIIMPRFKVICSIFGSIKSLDYSVFGIIKEMLYIPLKVEEKFKAKAIIDVFAYRSSKAVASIIILVLQGFYFFNLEKLLSYSVLFLFAIWMGAVLIMFKYYVEEINRQHINWPESQTKLPEALYDE